VDWRGRLSIDPAIRSGKPCITGTRITPFDILEYLAAGMSQAEVLDDFPDLAAADIKVSFAFVLERARHGVSLPQ
jgi:uncharacterized protein (DUF433 family)